MNIFFIQQTYSELINRQYYAIISVEKMKVAIGCLGSHFYYFGAAPALGFSELQM